MHFFFMIPCTTGYNFFSCKATMFRGLFVFGKDFFIFCLKPLNTTQDCTQSQVDELSLIIHEQNK